MPAARDEARMLGVTSAAHALVHLYELAFPAIALSMKDDLGWSLAEVLRASFLMYLLFGVGALPMGLLTDRIGARRMLVACMLGSGSGALAVSMADGRGALTLALACTGLAGSIYHPAGMALLSRTRRRGRALGLNGVFGNLGSAAAPFAGGLLAYEFGWRAAYAVLGVAGVGAGIVALGLRFDAGATAHAAQVPAGGGGRTSLGWFAILCAAMLLAGFSYRGFSIVLPAVFEAQTSFVAGWFERLRFESLGGLRNLAATTLASVAYAIGMLGQLVGGHLADKHDLRRMYLLFHAASLPFVIAMMFAREAALVAAACGFAFFALGMQPIENSLVARFTPSRWRSTAYGIKFGLNFGIGSTAVFAVTGLVNGGSFARAFALLAAVIAALCAIVALLAWRSRGVRVTNDAADAEARCAAI
jgi:MFS family permease